MNPNLFENVLVFPNSDFPDRYHRLVGLDEIKQRLEKEAETLLRPDKLEAWSKKHHRTKLKVLDTLVRRPPLFIFAGDVGTGKTELSLTFGDQIARLADIEIELFSLSLNTRGSGAVGEMTRLITEAFRELKARCPKPHAGKKPTGAAILVIDEADSLAQSRELAQMHHEDRAGVNALIRGIDEIAASRLPCIVVMCTNRLDSLDPAVRRRAAATFQFERPNQEFREKIIKDNLGEIGLSKAEINEIAELLGESQGRKYGYTFSDITQRYLPSLVLCAYPDHAISYDLSCKVARQITPTPPFKNAESG